MIDLRAAHEGLTGIGRYAANLARSLESVMGGHDIVGIASAAGYQFLRRGLSVPIQIAPGTGPEWNELGLPDLLRSWKSDIFHTPLFVLPALRSTRYVATLHDVIPAARPDLTNAAFQQLFQDFAPRLNRRADHIVAVSEFSRRDALKNLDLDPYRISVIHEPVDPIFHPRGREETLPVLTRFGLRSGFLLYVGAIDRRKNLPRILEALKGIHEEWGLVIVGGPSGDGYDIGSDVDQLGLRNRVHLLGRVSDEELSCLYPEAAVLVFPSLYEGFGLPIVEAMASSTPVVTSNVSSMPEVAGDAALLVDPESVDEIRTAILSVLRNRDLAADLRLRGTARAARFSLVAQGERLLELYRRLRKEAA